MSPQPKTPEQRDKERKEAASKFVEVALDDAYALSEELHDPETGLLARRRSNRNQLRDLARQGLLSDEQLAEVEEIYPTRTRRTDEVDAEDTGEAEPKAA